MSSQITTALKQEYHDMIEVGLQQRGSRLRSAVDNVTQRGKYGFYDRVEATAATLKTTRHADSPQSDTPHTRRRVAMDDYSDGDFIDPQDAIRISGNPESAYVQTRVMALGRAMDDAIIAAASGTAYEGETGGTSTALPSGQTIVHGSVGMTIAKLITTKQLLDEAEATDEPRYIAMTAEQIGDLLGTTQVTSSDYNTVKALAAGDIDTFMGFNFIRLERLAKASTTRTCLAWCRSGIKLATGIDIKTEIGPRADKSYSTYIYAEASFGAARMYEEKVVEIECTEAA